MKVITALREGWKQVVLHRRMWFILYLSNLVFAFIAVMPLYSWLKNAAGQSLALPRSIGQFDFTFIMDLIRNHEGYALLCTQALVIIIAYLIFSAFMTGGILHIYVHWRDQFLLKEFMGGAAKYFWRILRIAIYFLIVQIALLGLCILVLISIGINPREMENDVRFVQSVSTLLTVYAFFAMIAAIFQLYVKVHMVQQDLNPITKSMLSGIRFVLLHFGKVLLLSILNILFFIILLIAYLSVKELVPYGPAGGILLSFLLSQIFLLGRIVVKLLALSSAHELTRQVQAVSESGS